ncbi:MAG: carbohydrate ABC transporter permease [Coriobacteriia bacterium]|nr:carbohydrate ABC transporter permease [Coriobacteriia bacterium]
MSYKENKAQSIFRAKSTGLPKEFAGSLTRLVLPLFMGALVFLFCYPLIFIVSGSFMSELELNHHLAGMTSASESYAQLPPVPLYPTLESFIRLLVDTPAFYPLFWNSVGVVIAVLVGQALIAIPASWVFARYEFPLRRTLFFIYIVAMMMPFQVMMLPQYLILSSFGLLDTLFAIIVPGIFSAFPVFVLTHFFRTIPQNVIDAAYLDGAGTLAVLFRVGIPLAKPGIFAILFLGFIEYWNVIEQPLVFIREKTAWPLSLFLPSAGLEQASLAFVAAFVSCIPAIFAFVWGRKYLEQGISSMAKGQT